MVSGAGKGYGSIIAFEIKAPSGSTAKEAGQKFVEGLQLHSHVANIGDVRSLVIHPARRRGRAAPRPAGASTAGLWNLRGLRDPCASLGLAQLSTEGRRRRRAAADEGMRRGERREAAADEGMRRGEEAHSGSAGQ